MKKSVVVISSILQFIAVVMYFGVIKSAILWNNGEMTFKAVMLVAIIAIIAQVASFQLKKKYKDEVEKAEDIMQRPKTSYGWIALVVFGAVVLFFIIYLKFFLK